MRPIFTFACIVASAEQDLCHNYGMGGKAKVGDAPASMLMRALLPLMALIAGGLVLAVPETSTPVARAATVSAPSGDSDGACTQTVSSTTGVSVARSGFTCTVTFVNGWSLSNTWTVPSGIRSFSFVATASAGGSSTAADGAGGRVTGSLDLSSVSNPSLFIGVGGARVAADIRLGSTATADRIVVAGAGGSCGRDGEASGSGACGSSRSNGNGAGGDGGGNQTGDSPSRTVNGMGAYSGYTISGSEAGGGGTSAGGSAGGGSSGGQCGANAAAAAGTLESGGGGGNATGSWSCGRGGSGGNGYYGGGGGGGNSSATTDFQPGGGGGGGSSWTSSTYVPASGLVYARGSNSSTSGSVALSYVLAASSVSMQPSGGPVGDAFATQPAVTLTSGGGAAPAGVVVTAALSTSPTPSGLQNTPTLAGTLTATTVSGGVATFNDLKINGPTGSYTLSFSATGYPSVTSGSFTLTVGTGSALKVSTQPTGGTSGGVVTGSPAARVVDAGGNSVTSHPTTAVTVTSSTGTIGGTTTANTSSGVATFTAATLAGLVSTSHTLTFSAPGLGSVTSSTFSITVGVAAGLAIQTQPGNATGIGAALATGPVVRVVDSAGNVRTSDSSTLVTATIASGSSSASLSSNTRTTSLGSANFTGLTVNGAGGSFTLTFSAPGLASVTSSTFGVGVAGSGACAQTFSNTSFVTVTGPVAGVCTITFDWGVIPRIWTVPSGGLSNVSFTIRGGAGGGATSGSRVENRGAEFSGTIASLNGGEPVYVYVAQKGHCLSSGTAVWGGSWGGGGAGNNGACAGGGSTDIRIGGITAGFKKIVAGGGGGASGCSLPCYHGQDASATGAGPRGSWFSETTCWGRDGTSHNPNLGDEWSSGTGGNAMSCRNASSGGGGYHGGGSGSNQGGGNNGGDGGRGSSFIQSGFAVAATTSAWTGTGADTGTGGNNTFSMYTNHANDGQLVLSFSTSSNTVSRQPSGGQVGAVLGTQPTVTLESGGSVAAGVTVTAALATSPTPSGVQNTPALAGTLTAITDNNGVATFTNLAINGPTGAYTLSFSATGYPTATSNSITMTAGAASALKVSTQPTGGTSGGVVTGSPAVTVVDAGGNAVTSHPAVSVTVSSSTGTVGGTLSATTSSGVATFTAATLTGLVSTNHSLTFTSTGLGSVTSSTFTITVGAAAALSIQTQPGNATAIGSALGTQPVVRVVDSAGNVRTSDSSTLVTASIATGSSFGSLSSNTATAASGAATFSGLRVNGAGGSFTLTFSATGLASVTSSSFTVALTSQTVTFGALTGKTFGAAPFGISASTTSSLVIAFSSTTPAVCSVTGNTTATAGSTGAVVTVLGAGTCTIAADQAGNHQFLPATRQTQSFSVAQAAQATLTLTNSFSVTYGGTLTLSTSGGSGTGAVSYALVGGAGSAQCVLNPTTGAMTFGAAGTCSVRATKADDTNYTSVQSTTRVVTVARAAQSTSITSAVPSRPLPGGTYAVTATASSGLTPVLALMAGAGTVCSLSGSTVSFLATGTCVVLATQAGNTNYLPADPEDMQTIMVGSLNQNITFAQPSTMEFGDPDAVLSVSASSGLSVTLFSRTTSVCTMSGNIVSIVAVGDCEITASQSGDSRYAAASSETRVFQIVAVVANAPVIRSASASSGALTIGFMPPSFDGGATVTGYRLVGTPTSGGTTVTDEACVSSPCVINGLQNGTEYTVTVAAINAAGVGSTSSPSPALTPVTNAMAVQSLVSVPGDTTLTISWSTPADLGGGTFTRYEVRIRESGQSWPLASTQNVTSQSTTSLPLTGLSNGTEYEVQVVTITSANSESFEGNTAVVVAIPRRVPTAPRDMGVARTSPTGALVSWSAPLSNGGAPVTSYVVSFSDGASCGTVTINPTTLAGSCTATGLRLGTSFSVSVTAVNVAGSSPAATTSYSTPTFPVTLPSPPAQPPCATCTRDDDGNELPGAPVTTPVGQKPGTVTLTDGVVTVVLSGASGTEAVVNSDGQLEFSLGGKLSAAGSGVLATTSMATWWNRTATNTGVANQSGVATVEITPPSGTTAGVASVRVDAVSSTGAHRAFYFAVKVVGGAGASNAGGTTGGTSVDDPFDVTEPRTPPSGTTFDPESGETEILSPSGEVTVPTTTTTSNGIRIESDGMVATITAGSGTSMKRNSAGALVIEGTGKLRIVQSGLKPGSSVVVWLRPAMTRLALEKVRSNGKVDFFVTLPAGVSPGDHRLQVDMVMADGRPVSMAVGFTLSANRMPVAGSNTMGGLALSLLMVLAGLAVLAGRRRVRPFA